MADRRISELPFGGLTPDSIIPIITNNITSQTTFGVLLSKIPTSSGSNIDTFTTGGTYNEITGIATFTNNTGGTYSVTGLSIGNEYWSGGTGLNSILQINSNNQAIGINSFVVGSGNSANSDYSVAMGINSIADGFETLPIKTPKTVISGITMTSSDPNNSTFGVVFNGDVYAEWNEYLWDSNYWEENLFNIFDSSGNTYTINGDNLWDIYYDISSDSTYIVDGSIPLTSYLTISGAPFYDVITAFEKPAFVFGSNSIVTGNNSIVLGSNITGTSDNTTYVDYFKINRFIDDNVIFGPNAGLSTTGANNSNIIGLNAGNNSKDAVGSNFIGTNAGINSIYAIQSNFIGYRAGAGATNAFYSNFLGGDAGYNATNANSSNFFGNGAGYGATGASGSNFFGSIAGAGATGAYASIFLGSAAGYQAAGAYASNFMGQSAGQNAPNANQSNFIGHAAGYEAIGASNSNFFGYYAGFRATGASYSNLFGYRSGYASSTSNSLGSNNIIIGTNISLSAGTKNSINIGGVLFGRNTYSATTGNPSTIAQTGGTISINTINGTDTFNIESSSFGVAGQTFMELLSFKNTNLISQFNFNYTNFAVTNLVSGNSFVADTGNDSPYTTVPSIYKITSGGTISLVGNPNSGSSNTQIILSVNSADTIYYGFQSDVRIMTTGGTVSTLCTLPSVIYRIVWNMSSEMFILCANLNIYKVLTNGTFSVFHTLTEECYEISILSTGELIACIYSSSPFNITSNSIYKISLDGLSRTTLANATSGMTGTVVWSMIDKSDNIFTSRYSPYRIFKTTPKGVTTTFYTPTYYTYGMAVDSLNNIYIADMLSNNLLRKFTNDGRLISSSIQGMTGPIHMVMNSTNSMIVVRQGGVNFYQTNMGRSLLKVNNNGKVMYSDEIITESNTTYLPLSTILNTSADTTGKSIVTKEYAPITISDNIAVNNTTVDLTLSDLNSQYPSVYRGFKVHALSIVSGATIYEKTTTGWAKYASTIVV